MPAARENSARLQRDVDGARWMARATATAASASANRGRLVNGVVLEQQSVAGVESSHAGRSRRGGRGRERRRGGRERGRVCLRGSRPTNSGRAQTQGGGSGLDGGVGRGGRDVTVLQLLKRGSAGKIGER